MYSILVSDTSEYKKEKGVNKTFVAKISHNEYKDVMLYKKCLRHSMNLMIENWQIYVKIYLNFRFN